MPTSDHDLTVRVKAVLDGFTQPMKSATQQVKDFGSSAQQHVGVVGRLGEAFDDVGKHTMVFARGLEAMGLQSDAAAVKVTGIAEALKGFAAAAPEILAVGAALTAAFAGFELFKDAINIAGKTAASMMELSIVTRNQGGDWDVLRGKTEEYLDSAEKAAGFSRGDLADGLRMLGAAGKIGGDGFTYQRTAMDLARATGMSLAGAEEILIRASEGQARALVRLGILKKEDIKDGMMQSEMLEKVKERTQGAADAYATTLPGALDRVRAGWDGLLDALGKDPSGLMASFFNTVANGLAGVTNAYSNAAAYVKKWWADFYSTHRAGVDAVVGTMRLFFDLFIGIIRAGFSIAFGFIGMALDLITGNFKQFGIDANGALIGAFNGMQTAFGKFGDNMVAIAGKIAQTMATLFSGIGAAATKAMHGDLVGAAQGAIGTVASVIQSGSGIGAQIQSAMSQSIGSAFSGDAFSKLTSNFKLGNYSTSLNNDSQIPGAKTSKGGNGAANAEKNYEEAVKEWLAKFDAALDRAKNGVVRAEGKLAAYQALHGDTPRNAAEGRDQAVLIQGVAVAQRAVAAASNAKAIAEEHAAEAMLRYAAAIPRALKDHDELVRSARAAAIEHAKSARSLEQGRDAARAAADAKMREADTKANTGIANGADTAVERAKAQMAGETGQSDLEQARMRLAAADAGDSGKLAMTSLEAELAAMREQLAADAEAAARHEAALIRDAAATMKAGEVKDKENAKADALDKAADAATVAHINAETALVTATQNQAKASNDVGQTLSAIVNKIGIPGLKAEQDKNGNAHISLNPMELLLGVLEKTKSFADVMNIVNQVMKVFAEILDALRPVIDLLLKAFAAVANIFIDFYNIVARLLRIFGIQIPLLDKINTSFSDLIPFIQITHDLPTLNELAAGKSSPLSNTPHDYSSLQSAQQPMIDAINGSNLGGGIFGILGRILEAVVAVGAAILIGNALKGASGIIGEISSIGGGIAKLFGFGGAAASSTADLGAAVGGDAYGSGTFVAGSGGGAASLFGSGTIATTAATAGAAIIGSLGIGALAAGLTGGNKQTGAIGGLVGAAGAVAASAVALGSSFSAAAAGLLAAGPAGWAVLAGGALLGGVLGGLFGSHETKKDQPDLYLPGYKDWLKQMNSSSTTTGIGAVETSLASANPANLTGQALADYQRLKGLGGASGNLGVANEKNDTFTLGSGAKINVEEYMALVKRALTEFGNALGPVTTSLATLAAGATAVTNGISAAGNGLVATASAVTSTVAKRFEPVAGPIQAPPITVTVTTGDLHHPVDVEHLSNTLGQSVSRALLTSGWQTNRVQI